ncbi:RNA polymerase sigma factor [Pseudoalteromonas fenneropenaei]|uniref:RNA polymerase sigma factor n=1 Tax=Pseudoalteromonas fenneropenaei TaxID=1737459 RepID=A0ABV7CLX0_9GAMM
MIFSSEAALIRKAQQGDKQAWLALVKRHESIVFNHCLRLVGNRDDACDLMQEVFVSVFKALPQFAGDCQFKTWLFRLTHARCVDHFRKRKPTTGLEEAPEAHVQGEEEALLTQLDNQQVHQALQALTHEQRQVIELKFFQHFTFEEIAQMCDLSVNTVKTRLYSALKKMKGQLEVIHG